MSASGKTTPPSTGGTSPFPAKPAPSSACSPPRPDSGPRRERHAVNWNGPQPAVLVIHENRGLVEHIRDVTRRVAKAGFVALGLDLLSRQGGTAAFADDNARAQAYGRTLQTERHEDMQSAVDYLRKLPNAVANRVGVIGFWPAAATSSTPSTTACRSRPRSPSTELHPPRSPAADRVTTPLLCIYSENDRAQAARIPELSESLVAARVTFGIQLYKGTNHAFFNDTGAVYNSDAALDAWDRTMDFLNTRLRAPV